MKAPLNLAQFDGPWGIDPQRLQTAVELLRTMGVEDAVSVSAEIEDMGKPAVEKAGRVAVINISGPLTKFSHGFMGAFGGTATTEVQRALDAAVRDPGIDAIVLHIDSPGGTVAGSVDLAEDVARARESKPIVAFAEDMMASAAFWIGSQTDAIVANRAAAIGSIGVITMVYDVSKLFTEMGVKPIPITTSKFKGAFTMGTEVTQEQIDRYKAEIQPIHDQFVADIKAGRKLTQEQVEKAADGRLFAAPKAFEMGLIDGIGRLKDAVVKARELAQARGTITKTTAASGEGSTGAHSQASSTTHEEHPLGQPGAAPVDIVATPASEMEKGAKGLTAADVEALIDRRVSAVKQEYEAKISVLEQRQASTDAVDVAKARTALAMEFGLPEAKLAHLKSRADIDTQRALLEGVRGAELPPSHEELAKKEKDAGIPDAFAEAEAYHLAQMRARGTPVIQGGA